MAEPENQTLRVLREIRTAIKALDGRVDRNHEELRSRLDNIRKAAYGETVLGQYATAEYEERFEALEKRVTDLESAK